MISVGMPSLNPLYEMSLQVGVVEPVPDDQ